jgi:hypothetical protein
MDGVEVEGRLYMENSIFGYGANSGQHVTIVLVDLEKFLN